MWFLKSKRALRKELLLVITKGRRIVNNWTKDKRVPEEQRAGLAAAMLPKFEDMSNADTLDDFSRKQLYLFAKMFKLILKAKKYELALIKSIELD